MGFDCVRFDADADGGWLEGMSAFEIDPFGFRSGSDPSESSPSSRISPSSVSSGFESFLATRVLDLAGVVRNLFESTDPGLIDFSVPCFLVVERFFSGTSEEPSS